MATKYTKLPQNIPNRHKMYQMATKYTKWPQNIPKKDQMVIEYIYQHLQLDEPPNFTQIGIFGLKICHLATLIFSIDGTSNKG
jgi:hypothetical protein